MIAGQMIARTGVNKVQTKEWQPENAAAAQTAPNAASGAASAPAAMPASAPAETAASAPEIQAASAAK